LKVIFISESDGLTGFPNQDVILLSLVDHFTKVKLELTTLIDDVHEDFIKILNSIIKTICRRYPKLIDTMEELITIFTEKVT
jgi:hypothetical protein